MELTVEQREAISADKFQVQTKGENWSRVRGRD
jgi:hypothetical protein